MEFHKPYFEDARIVNVIANHIKSEKRLIVVGPRDVGKSLYVQLAVWRASVTLNEQILEICNRDLEHRQKQAAELWIPHPVSLRCPEVGKTRLADLVYCGVKIRQKPIYLIDDAHLCKGMDILELYRDGIVILIYPSPSKPPKRPYTEVQILPFRLIEVAEVLRRDVRSKLTENKHYKGEDRLHNLQKLQRSYRKIKKLNEIRHELDEILKRYLLYGGTAWGIELIAQNLSNKIELEAPPSPPIAFFDTIDEILEDAKEYGQRPEAVMALLYLTAERVFKEGLEVGDIYEEVRNLAQDITNVKLENRDVVAAMNYLRNSHILFTIRKKVIGKGPEDRQLEKESGSSTADSDSRYKIVFSDPRYALGAYMHYYHTAHETTYEDAYREVANKIVHRPHEVPHYLESVFLANVALGAYALVTSIDRPERGHHPDKYVKYLKSDWEIDAYVAIKRGNVSISFLAEFSITYDRNHVKKCREAANALNTYCIYAVYKDSEVRLENNVLVTPLSLFLALL